MKNNPEQALKSKKTIALLAPSFVSVFSYPDIVIALKKLGFEKVVELTFGAKMVNSEYHKILNRNKMHISTACPGITEFIKTNYPQLKDNLIPIDSPMIATAKICKKNYPKYKTVFISPCNFKKQEAESSKYVDYTIDYQQLKELLIKNNIPLKHKKPGKFQIFDSFYNDYTKIYPMAGGLSKTAHLKGILDKNEVIVIDGVQKVKTYLDNYIKNPDKKIKFLDINFCVGGCLGGPHTNNVPLPTKKKRLLKYLNLSKKEKIPEKNKGWIKKANGISFKII
jgi:iron only hydrogenase large subunit-like protein